MKGRPWLEAPKPRRQRWTMKGIPWVRPSRRHAEKMAAIQYEKEWAERWKTIDIPPPRAPY